MGDYCPMLTENLIFEEGATNVDRAKNTIGAMQEILMREIGAEFGKRFGDMLDRGHHKYHAMGTLHGHMERLRTARPEDVIRAVRLELHNYFAAFGVSTAGFKIDLLGDPTGKEPDGRKLLLPEEKESPGMLFTPELPKIYKPTLLGLPSRFGGAEKATAVSERITMRGYLPGEAMQKTDSVPQLRRGESIVSPHGTMLGIRVQVVDRDKLNAAPLPHASIMSERTRRVPADPNHRGEILWHTSLTREAALEAMGM